MFVKSIHQLCEAVGGGEDIGNDEDIGQGDGLSEYIGGGENIGRVMVMLEGWGYWLEQYAGEARTLVGGSGH